MALTVAQQPVRTLGGAWAPTPRLAGAPTASLRAVTEDPKPTPDPMPASLRAQLDRVAAYEGTRRSGLVHRATRRLGKTAAFARVYRVVGPKIDPKIGAIKDGRYLATVYGFPILMLHHIGAKSGQERVSPLVYVRDGDDFALVGTNFGQAKHPAWTFNLLAHPDVAVGIGGVHLRVRADLIDDQAAFDRLWPEFVDAYPGYANYLTRRPELPPRMFRLRPQA
jgi:deazaflavin-dependent oxidoreductase (nitroreductase family)